MVEQDSMIEQGFRLAAQMGTPLIGGTWALYASGYQNGIWSCSSGTTFAPNICVSP